MRILALSVAAIVLAASQVSSLHGQTAAMSHASVLSGTIQSPICSSDNFASGEASGDLQWILFPGVRLPGWLDFRRHVADPRDHRRADGTTEMRGTLRGQVLRGSFES